MKIFIDNQEIKNADDLIHLKEALIIDKLVEEISDELHKENAPKTTGVLQKTPRKVMIQQMIQLYLDTLIDRIFDTDDDYMNNQRWKK